MTDTQEVDSRFTIPSHPERRYPRTGGVEYEGETVFRLIPTPEAKRDDDALEGLVESVLDDEPYTYGDWFNLPMLLYLVHDGNTGDVFRVAVRDGAIELHVLPETDSGGLRALFDRLQTASDYPWQIDRRITDAD